MSFLGIGLNIWRASDGTGAIGPFPSWVPSVDGQPASLAFDFAQQVAWGSGASTTPGALLTCTRASAGYVVNSSGLYQSIGNNILRFTYNPTTLAALGLLIEETRTNTVLQNRDLTNAAWVATNMTAAKDQVGIDGVANSASSIIATAGNATILQTIVDASSIARYQSAFVKRLVGTGAIQMTMDGGATWTTITVTNSWTPLEIPTQTLSGPVVGFRVVTNGDKVAIDFVQNENGIWRTSPILVTTVAAARAADVVNMTLPAAIQSLTAYTLGVVAIPNSPTTNAASQALASIDDASINNRIQTQRTATNTFVAAVIEANTVLNLNVTGSVVTPVNTVMKTAIAEAAASQAAYLNGGQIGTASGAGAALGINTLHVGGRFDSLLPFNGTISSLAVWTFKATNAGLVTITV